MGSHRGKWALPAACNLANVREVRNEDVTIRKLCGNAKLAARGFNEGAKVGYIHIHPLLHLRDGRQLYIKRLTMRVFIART